MANLIIVDTGYPNTTKTGAQAASTLRANAGVRIPLRGVSLNYERSVNIDTAPTIGKFYNSANTPKTPEPSVSVGSINAPKISISGVIKQYGLIDTDNDGSADDNEIDMVYLLDRLAASPYVKCLYYSKVISGETYTEATDPYKGIVKSLGNAISGTVYADGTIVPASTPYLTVHVESIRIPEPNNSNLIRWTMNLIVTS